MVHEMRKHERVSLEAAACVSDGCVETPAIGLNVSRAGLGLRTAFLWEPGTRLTVRIRLPDGACAVALAVVQRASGDVMGLRLLAAGPAFARLVGAAEPALPLSA